MQDSQYNLTTLFSKLGINNSPRAIDAFIKEHQGQPADLSLAEATFCNQAHVEFLQQAITEESNWFGVVVSLESLLRH